MSNYHLTKDYFWNFRKRAIIIPLAFVLGMMIVPDLLFNIERIQKSLIASLHWAVPMILFLIVFVEVVMFFQRKSEIKVSDGSIKRVNGKSEDEIKFNDISKLIIRSYKGKIHSIQIKSKKKKMLILGYEKMEDIADKIKSKIKDSAVVKVKNWKIQIQNPFVSGAILFLMAFVLAVTFQIYEGLVEIMAIPAVGLFVGGVFYLFWRPFSEAYGKKYLVLDIFFGLFFLVGSCLFYFIPMN